MLPGFSQLICTYIQKTATTSNVARPKKKYRYGIKSWIHAHKNDPGNVLLAFFRQMEHLFCWNLTILISLWRPSQRSLLIKMYAWMQARRTSERVSWEQLLWTLAVEVKPELNCNFNFNNRGSKFNWARPLARHVHHCVLMCMIIIW